MNQRVSRKSKKNNQTDFVSINTGGQTVRHTPNLPVEVQVPKPQPGSAKASPNFKPIVPPTKVLSKEDEKKVIAKNTTPVDQDDKNE